MLRCIPFYGTVSASSEQTLVSDPLSVPYTVRAVQFGFPLGMDRLVQMKVFVSGDSADPASGQPTGDNLFCMTGQVEYVVGDDATVVIPVEHPVDESPTWIKVYANNTDTYDHTIDVRVIVDVQGGGPKNG